MLLTASYVEINLKSAMRLRKQQMNIRRFATIASLPVSIEDVLIEFVS